MAILNSNVKGLKTKVQKLKKENRANSKCRDTRVSEIWVRYLKLRISKVVWVSIEVNLLSKRFWYAHSARIKEKKVLIN